MFYTPRVPPDGLRGNPAQPGGVPGPSGPVLIATGEVIFNATTDAAGITLGQYKPVQWYTTVIPSPINPISPGPLCAFAIENVTSEITAAVPPAKQLYDLCAEVKLDQSNAMTTPGETNPVAVAWIWDTLSGFEAVVNATRSQLFMGYEGSPIAPNLYVRSGMVVGVTDPTMEVTHRFNLYMLPGAAFGSARAYVPSPWCAPPFMPFGANLGTHLFSQHVAQPTPSGQSACVKNRIFRPLTWRTDGPAAPHPVPTLVVDARIFGGPWNGHVLGIKPTADPTGCTWDIEEMLRSGSIAWPYSPPVLATANNYGSLYTPRPVDALRVTLNAAEATHPRTDLILTYPH